MPNTKTKQAPKQQIHRTRQYGTRKTLLCRITPYNETLLPIVYYFLYDYSEINLYSSDCQYKIISLQ